MHRKLLVTGSSGLIGSEVGGGADVSWNRFRIAT